MKTNLESPQQAGCPVPEDLLAHARGEGGAEERARREDHIRGCPVCRAECEAWQAFALQCRATPLEAPAMDVTDAVMGDVSRIEGEDTLFRRWTFGLARIAALLLVGWMAGLLFTRTRSGSRPEPVLPERTVAVRQAIEWLESAQEPAGSWDPLKWGGRAEYETSLTGLALLAGVRQGGDGMLPETMIRRGLHYLLSTQRPDGGLGPESDGMMYNHGIATVALLEIYRVMPEPGLREALDRALAFTVQQQQASGGWGYSRDSGRAPNTSISVWQVRSLHLAQEYGFAGQVPALRRGLAWVRSMVDESGQFGYEAPKDMNEAHATLTLMGAYCLLSAGKQSRQDLPPGLMDAFHKALLPGPAERQDFYHAFFAVAALDAGRPQGFSEKLDHLQNALAARRVRSGHHTGSWAPEDRWSSVGGRLYSTAMATLSLEAGSAPRPITKAGGDA